MTFASCGTELETREKLWRYEAMKVSARFAGLPVSLTSPRHSRNCNVFSCARSVCGNISKYHGTSRQSDTAFAPRCYLWTALLLMCRGQFHPPEDAGDWGTGSARRSDAASECQHRGSTVSSATAELAGHRSARTSRLRCGGMSPGREKTVSWLVRVRLSQLARYGSNVRNFSLNWCVATHPGQSAFVSLLSPVAGRWGPAPGRSKAGAKCPNQTRTSHFTSYAGNHHIFFSLRVISRNRLRFLVDGEISIVVDWDERVGRHGQPFPAADRLNAAHERSITPILQTLYYTANL